MNQLSSGNCAVIGKTAAAAAAGHALDQAMPPLIPAILCTLGTVTVPSAASVYNEFALKRHMDTSVHLQVRYEDMLQTNSDDCRQVANLKYPRRKRTFS